MDKWPAGKVQVFQALTNDLVNTYWEANLPSGFSKPGPSANNMEVVRFMTDKYINKKWVDTKMKHDPLYLFENKKDKFDRWLRKRLGASKAADQDEDEPEEPPKLPKTQKAVSMPVPKPVPVQPTKMPEVGDLINMQSSADTFEDFQSATPSAPAAPSNFDSLLNLYAPQ